MSSEKKMYSSGVLQRFLFAGVANPYAGCLVQRQLFELLVIVSDIKNNYIKIPQFRALKHIKRPIGGNPI